MRSERILHVLILVICCRVKCAHPRALTGEVLGVEMQMDQNNSRDHRSTNYHTGNREKLYILRGGCHIAIYDNGTVAGSYAIDKYGILSKNQGEMPNNEAILNKTPFLSSGPEFMVKDQTSKLKISLQGDATNLYLCVNNKGRYYTRKDNHPDCHFLETLEENGMSDIYSATHKSRRGNWYIYIRNSKQKCEMKKVWRNPKKSRPRLQYSRYGIETQPGNFDPDILPTLNPPEISTKKPRDKKRKSRKRPPRGKHRGNKKRKCFDRPFTDCRHSRGRKRGSRGKSSRRPR